MLNKSKIDVVVPSYNRLDYLLQSIKSIKKQSYTANQIIVVDDDSEFSEKDFWSGLKRENICTDRILFYKKEKNLGACHSRNLGVQLSKSEYVAFLDDDDLWEINHLEGLINCFQNDDIVLAYSGKLIKNFTTGKERKSLNVIPDEQQFLSLLKCNYPGSTSSIMVRKKSFFAAGGFDETLPAIQDYDFYLRIVKEGRITTSNIFTLIYRVDTPVKITNQLYKARKAYYLIIEKLVPQHRKVLAKTISIQNIKKA
ncbi:glycosyltransferase family 2 protein, partial [Escherichia coli]|nr:glycosyltransferase family 2 protein [Escherichia coli]